MLNLRYLSGPADTAPGTPPAPVGPEGHALLATIAFGADTQLPAGEGAALALPGVATCGDAAQLLEQWIAASPVSTGRRGALRYTHDAYLLFGTIQLAESKGSDLEAPGLEAPDLETNTASAYRQIFALLDEFAFPHVWRVWNFIPHINAETGGLERYRRFNVARQDAFAAAGRATLAAVPAASAVGSAAGDLAIYFVAGRAAPLPVENPRQLSAYDYPPEYGPRSPLFARACLAPYANGELLFISGTASIVGHRTLHIGDIRAQTRESLANIDAVLAAANARVRHRQFARADLAYKVYVRHVDDLAAIRREFEAWLPGAAAVYLQADICRAELLVEIEASAGHDIAAFSL